jgi:3-hydroxyisobutyrate dehydrogenase/glyoxylate/succinic semialdehyde reductase
MEMKIGFIGLGIMGSRMAANLQKHGYPLVVFNRTRSKAENLLANGAEWAASPAAVAGQVEVLFTMLAHPEAVKEAALGKDGFLAHLAPDALWVDCSTVNPSFSKQMAAEADTRRVHFLGAPVSGSKTQAADGTLIFWVGGAALDLVSSWELLNCMGTKIIHAGGPGMGAALKMVINQLLGTTMAAFAEGIALGQALGLPREVLFKSLLSTPAAAPFLTAKREKIENGNYAADFPLRWLQKDLHLAAVSAYEAGVAMPLTNVVKEIYRLAIREGDGDKDFSAIYHFLARDCDVKPNGNRHLDQSDDPASQPTMNVNAHDS